MISITKCISSFGYLPLAENNNNNSYINKDSVLNKPMTINYGNKSKKITFINENNLIGNKMGPPQMEVSSIRVDATTTIAQNQNYSISGLNSSDETDDEDMPNKPIPDWATNARLKSTSLAQSTKCINFTQVFRSTLKENVILEDVFSIKKKHFHMRTSSANWNFSPPVW